VAFSPDGQLIVSGAGDGSVRVWDALSGQQRACLQGHTNPVTSVAFSPDGQLIVSGSLDQTVRVWDAVGGYQRACLQGHTDWVIGVAFSPDGQLIVSGSYDQMVRVWDAVSGVCREVHPPDEYLQPTAPVRLTAAWQVQRREGVSALSAVETGQSVAWCLERLDSSDPSGRIWAGGINEHLIILRLEGRP
jgi:WD40 repeat protein